MRCTRLAVLPLLVLLAMLLLCTLPRSSAAAAGGADASSPPSASATAASTTHRDFGDVSVDVLEDEDAGSSSDSHPVQLPGISFGTTPPPGEAQELIPAEERARQAKERAKKEELERLGPKGVTPNEPIQLMRHDFCKACYTVVEEFHKWTVGQLSKSGPERNKTMSRSELVEWFCKTGPFEHWKQPLIHGCIKTVQDHHDEVLAPFLGVHVAAEYSTLAGVFAHKISACSSPTVDACDPWVPEGRPKDDCQTCRRLVSDMHWSLSREVRVTTDVVKKVLGVLCMEAGMRHDKPMEVEAFCHEHIDEHWKDMQPMLVKVYNDASIVDKTHAVTQRFCGMMTEVCPEERKAMLSDIAARKAQERKERLAKREAKGRKQPAKPKDEL